MFFILSFYFSDILKENPSHCDLLNLLADINNKWKDIGLALSLPQNFIEGLEKVLDSDNVKLSKVITEWIDTMPSPVTWETIISVVEGPIVNNQRKANDIRQHLAIGKSISIESI